MVAPSGGALTTTSVPTEPPAPGRFSTIIGWPSVSPMKRASSRAAMSLKLPGPKATMMR